MWEKLVPQPTCLEGPNTNLSYFWIKSWVTDSFSSGSADVIKNITEGENIHASTFWKNFYINILYKTSPKHPVLWVEYLLSVSKLKSVQSREQKKKINLMFKMLQITENISWSKESALQSQAMENKAWHLLAPKWSPWDCIYPCIIKLVSMVFSCSMLFSFGTWIWKWEEHSEFRVSHMHCTRKAQSIWSALIAQSFWNTEMAQQLCQIRFCALKRPRQALRWLNVDDGSPKLPGLPSKGWGGDTIQLGLQQAEG